MSRDELMDHIEVSLLELREDQVDGFIEEMLMEHPESASIIEARYY